MWVCKCHSDVSLYFSLNILSYPEDSGGLALCTWDATSWMQPTALSALTMSCFALFSSSRWRYQRRVFSRISSPEHRVSFSFSRSFRRLIWEEHAPVRLTRDRKWKFSYALRRSGREKVDCQVCLVCWHEGLINRLTTPPTNTQPAAWCKAAWLVQSGLLSSRGPKALFMSWANLQSSRRPLVLLSALGWITCPLNGLKQSQTLPQRPGNRKIWHSWSTFGIKRSGAKWAIVKAIVHEIRKSQDCEWFVWAAFYLVFF